MTKNCAVDINYIYPYCNQIKFTDIIKSKQRKENRIKSKPSLAQEKLLRKKLMDKVKEFVDYAYDCGSKNCAMYYISFSNLVKNKDLRIVYPIIYEKIDTGIKMKLAYKEIYKNCSKEIKEIRKLIPIPQEV